MKKYLLSILILFLFFSCEKESNEPANFQNVYVTIDHIAGNNNFELNNTYLNNSSGNSYNISQLKYFISNITFIDEEGNEEKVDDSFFINLEENKNKFDFGISGTTYNSIKFYVGLDSATNHSDPAKQSANSVLNPANTDMHWNWMSGYIFLSIEGYLFENGVESDGFSYHIGKMENLIEVIITPENGFDFSSTNNLFIELDLSKIFDGQHTIDISNELVTHSSNDNGLSKKLSENISEAFSIR
jgi:archaellin